MKFNYFITFLFLISAGFTACEKKTAPVQKNDSIAFEPHRPLFHFTPAANWMNDPNGLVYYKGEYHLFYQYYPDSTVWGPMHWGHATSKDLFHWNHQPIALRPDSLGLIFSGSAVLDEQNSSGFGSWEHPPLVAIYTYHSVEKQKSGKSDFQYQGIAYSTDNGITWTKYKGNPVLRNTESTDFRDPKVFWHGESKRWVMVLAVKDHVELYASADLKAWAKLSEFGKELGSHGGVWECPDLFEMTEEDGKSKKWVMLVSVNPGGPNGGSGTQYFTGRFDGHKFEPDAAKEIKWLDYGPDNYAGVTWSNVHGRKLFLGWMSNWAYAERVPTTPWRSAMTVPRELFLFDVGGNTYVRSAVAKEINSLVFKEMMFDSLAIGDSLVISKGVEAGAKGFLITGEVDAKDVEFVFSNSVHQQVVIGFDVKSNQYYIDRSKSGRNDFSTDFPRSLAPRISQKNKIAFTILCDVASVEVFLDKGLTTMTSVFFTDQNIEKVIFRSVKGEVATLSVVVKQLKPAR